MTKSHLWPLSTTATALVWLGYVPEMRRLCVQRSASGTSVLMWFIWIASSLCATIYAVVSEAQALIVLNSGTICALTCVVAFGNGYFCYRERRRKRPDAEPEPPADDVVTAREDDA